MPPESLGDKLTLILADKGALALLLALVGFWFTREVEKLKSALSKQNQLETEKRNLETSLEKQKHDLTIQFIEKQLSEFYWPIYLRLQKDCAIWQKIPDLHEGGDQVPTDIGQEIERRVLLPNHEEIVKIIEAKIHLAEPDDGLSALLQAYMRHVAIYQALRASKIYDKSPRNYNEPFPEQLIDVIVTKTKELQRRYDDLVRMSSDS